MILALSLLVVVHGAPELSRFSTDAGGNASGGGLNMQLATGQALIGTATSGELTMMFGAWPAGVARPRAGAIFRNGFEG